MSERPMTCEIFDEWLSAYLEGELAATECTGLERHASACARCGALLADLETIRREAGSLPPLVPSRDLWAGIEQRIQSPVISIDSVARPADIRRPARHWWMGIAAAALVAASSAITYGLTKRSVDREQLASESATAPAPVFAPETAIAPEGPLVAGTDTVSKPGGPERSDTRLTSGATRGTTASAASGQFDRDLAQLQRILRQQRSQLDPRTVAELEESLRVIDQAVRQSFEALRRDPNSEFLSEQYSRALGKKAELLRTAALLTVRS